ncbi:vomeronasal type-2 receptor 26-like [Sceloporus undulatus]|uniref:vomeronasal type-2 receptor 26-like n=1 Tax=Sceloporus undulatus TaxID=8520 RepID=UPI001C4D3FCF|nr:vomeronasal type-2 receptor 26-like [Sceloporus undulatus]
MVPNEVLQYQGIVQLLLHFRWKWVGLMTNNDDDGEHFLQTMEPMLFENGMCSAFTNKSPSEMRVYNFVEIDYIFNSVPIFSGNKAQAVVIYGKASNIRWLAAIMLATMSHPSTNPEYMGKASSGKVWIMTAQIDCSYLTFQKKWGVDMFHGAISFTLPSKQHPGFEKFLQSLHLHWAKEDGFIHDFWEQAFNCFFPTMDLATNANETCTGEEKTESLPRTLFDMSMTGHSYSIYNAVYAVACALHIMCSSRSNHKRMRKENIWVPSNVKPWQLHSFLQSISFNNGVGDEIKLNEDGELVAGFDITNMVTFLNNSYIQVKVGKLDARVPGGKPFTIDKERLQWHRNLTQVPPFSLCNDPCYPGYMKNKKEGMKFCCYSCSPCPEDTISDQEDMDYCFSCSEDHFPNNGRNKCIPKVQRFLSFQDPLGITLAFLALFFSLITIVVLGIFIKEWDSPIVKANNRGLTILLLISLLLCFLCALFFITEPKKEICILQQTIFGIIFSIAVSSLLAKTMTVIMAFMASNPSSTFRKWVGKRSALSIVSSCSLVQVAICAIWLGISPPFPEKDMHSVSGEIIVICNEGLDIMFCCALSYLGFLAILSFIVAFLARKLPDSFNEAKFITFSMLVFCSVWLSFVPAYLSSKGKKLVVVEVFSILSSGLGLLACIFAPKCYIIVLRPHLNKKEKLIRRQH